MKVFDSHWKIMKSFFRDEIFFVAATMHLIFFLKILDLG